ncbi:hypothetical protein [Rubripirellula reticaptiva]|uniref:Mannitol repressor protein n=1 Tax=Rubripirellula reticaptiva TaxID=2528013 RepID=A0A5C6EQG4_9BACT|nr:hypothetical protein [Rubripirellula reticaptiva]TWU51158.1 hypothetical protein Poly59_27480 [Rubripirellula reticaptiva]
MHEAETQFRDFFAFYANEPPRSAAILVPAKLDALLRDSIERRLIPADNPKDDPLLSSDRALGTFSSRIEIAYRLGLIDSQFKSALHLLRKIRNEFAHGFDDQDFSTPQHRSRILELVKPILHTRYFTDATTAISGAYSMDHTNYLVVSGMMTGGLSMYSHVVQPIGANLLRPLAFDPDNG